MDMFKKSEGKQQPAVSEPDKPITFTKQDLADVVAAAVRAATQLNPIEQRKLEQELAAQERRDQAAIQLAKIEQEAAERYKNSCSHSRHPMAMGKLGGHPAPKGTGEWTTGGQCHSPRLATLICVRCAHIWQFEPTDAEYEQFQQSGMMGIAPPPEHRLIKVEEVA